MTKQSRETRASNLRVWGAFTILRRRGVEFIQADKIAARYNRRFAEAERATMTQAEREELKARRVAGSKLIYGEKVTK